MSVAAPTRAGSTVADWRVPLLGVAGLRAALALVAVPLAPALHRDHFAALVALRPTKEVLLAAGFLVRDHRVALVSVVLAALPLLLGGVWLFFWLGRAWSEEICSGEGLPRWAARLLPPDRIRDATALVEARGRTVVLLGRLAVFPSSVMAAAAGAAGMSWRDFLLADGVGGLLSLVEVAGAGYVLGEAYEDGSRWITVAGVVVLAALLVVLGRWLKGQSGSSSRVGT